MKRKEKIVDADGIERTLTNGKGTTSLDKYVRDYRSQYRYLEKQFPDLKIIGFDPGFLFKWKGYSIDLPSGFVRDLIQRLKTGKPISKSKSV